jgi:hypothetical protein
MLALPRRVNRASLLLLVVLLALLVGGLLPDGFHSGN